MLYTCIYAGTETYETYVRQAYPCWPAMKAVEKWTNSLVALVPVYQLLWDEQAVGR